LGGRSSTKVEMCASGRKGSLVEYAAQAWEVDTTESETAEERQELGRRPSFVI